jgi:hypothetical protein
LQNELELFNQENKESKRLLGKRKSGHIEDKSTKEIPSFPKLSLATFKRTENIDVSKTDDIEEN